MAGKLYGVGVGPGDPELLTLKALRLVKEAEVIALPGQVPEDTVAFKIVEGAYPELGKKELLAVPFPMSKDPEVLKSYHDAGAEKVKAVLDQGKDVVFLTLGDPTVYSTYLYIHHRLVAQGYETEIVCGITSFCCICTEPGVYTSGYFPECDHHKNGRKDTGAGKREHSVLCRS